MDASRASSWYPTQPVVRNEVEDGCIGRHVSA